MIRKGNAVWQGTGKEGTGHLSTQSGVLTQTQYSFNTRFADGIGTNPEELIAAAHAGCFTMKLSFLLNAAGFTADKLDTSCEITLENGAVTKSHLILKASVQGIDAAKFAPIVKEAETTCPISKLLNTAISVEYSLNG